MDNIEPIQLTVSTSRKINHAVYGASDYESSDKFCSLTVSVPDGVDIKALHRQVLTEVEELNNSAVARDILKIQGGMDWKEYLAALRQYRLGHLELNDTFTTKLNQLQLSVLEEFKKLKRSK